MAISDAVMVLSKCHRAASQAMDLGGKNLVSERSEVLFLLLGNFKKVLIFIYPAKAAYFHTVR